MKKQLKSSNNIGTKHAVVKRISRAVGKNMKLSNGKKIAKAVEIKKFKPPLAKFNPTPKWPTEIEGLKNAQPFKHSSRSSSGSSVPQTILLFGYWPPTGTDFMLKDYLGGKLYRDYFIQAYSPTFGSPPTPTGWQPSSPTSKLVPWWGPGSGHPLVDYQDTATYFWKTVNVPNKDPIAIMSFSRGLAGVDWLFEINVYNYARLKWQTGDGWQYYSLPTPVYPPPIGSGTVSGPVSVTPLAMPFIGGSSADPSPYKNKGTRIDNPPDRSLPAVSYPPLTVSRTSNLPTAQIKSAINAAISASKVNPNNNTDPDKLGQYVSAYMAYLVCWYGRDQGVQPKNAAIKNFGHTHVGYEITPIDAAIAFKAQLDALIDSL